MQEVEIQELVFSEGILQFTKLNENKGHRKEERERRREPGGDFCWFLFDYGNNTCQFKKV